MAPKQTKGGQQQGIKNTSDTTIIIICPEILLHYEKTRVRVIMQYQNVISMDFIMEGKSAECPFPSKFNFSFIRPLDDSSRDGEEY